MWMDKLVSIHSIRQVGLSNSDAEEYVEGEQHCGFDSQRGILRTQLLLLDYKQFKAARLIQRIFRGWRVRDLLKKQHRAAVTIQRIWRHYCKERHRVVEIQEETQSCVLISHHSSCVKIQALFRGWYSRKYINNMMYLKNIQLAAMEDILHSIIYKLHSMKRTDQLPGILAFREGETLGKVEDFMSTMTYRLFNRYVGRKWAMSKTILESQRMDFKKAVEYTWAPYFGNDHINVCNPPPPPRPPKSYERREYDVSQAFMASKRDVQEQKAMSKSISRRTRNHILKALPSNQKRFCRDLIHSMKRWTIDEHQKLNIPDDLRVDSNLKGFLEELQGYLTSLNYIENCDCLRDSPHPHKLTPRFD
ncbi:uncharacterized protein LOC132798613 [Drosophila nasuta]|uniref:uncharacterized protein LOC132798613 n=1 Tax=Drosophila nasuta TaxID=42062 RepID=UPI00295F218F|nr:uncharacterized protein LOC132798613 [Drosophila nasuta]